MRLIVLRSKVMLESEGRIRDAIQQAAARECVKVKEHIGEQITVQIFDKELALSLIHI